MVQGSSEWFTNRIGIITASKLPTLLGMNGHKEFDASWFCIKNRLDESTYRPKKLKNFEWGQMYEKAALDNFSKVSGKGHVLKYHTLNEKGLISQVPNSGTPMDGKLKSLSTFSRKSNLKKTIYFY